MAWGLVVGPVAGVLPAGLAAAVHIPTVLLTGYVASVARLAAELNAPGLGLTAMGLLAVLVAIAMRIEGPWRWAFPLVGLVLAWIAAPTSEFDVRGAELYRSEGVVVVVIDRPSPERLLSGIRLARVNRVDLVVMASSSTRATVALSSLRARHEVGVVLAAQSVDGTVRIREPVDVDVGLLTMRASPRGNRIDVEVCLGVRSSGEHHDCAGSDSPPQR
jgi:hypothetical protein